MKAQRVLISNRGEIAIRLIRACREHGLTSIFFYPAGIDVTLERSLADESYEIATEDVYVPFLNIDTIIKYAQHYQIDAIHPGYGFLAEFYNFAEACQNAGIVFIGPSTETLKLTGNKVATKKLVKSLNIPILPGSYVISTYKQLEHLLKQKSFELPLIVKPANGGGGKGIFVLTNRNASMSKFQQIQQQSKTYFGSSDIFVEGYCAEARHIEIQVMGNGKNKYLFFPARDCTLQRKHQKIVEESPSAFINAKLEQVLQNAAIKIARAVCLRGLATIEFLVDKNHKYYFLEVNPRIQVEHGVTEFLTGVDLAKEQINLALGGELDLEQKNIKTNGWVIECRLNAENPWDNFAPSAGTITNYRIPTGPGIRVDDGIYNGQEVSIYFDSLLAKIMVYAKTRKEAIIKMRNALSELFIEGIVTNQNLLQNLLQSKEFILCQHTTSFVEQFIAAERLAPSANRLRDLLSQRLPRKEAWEEVLIAELVAELYRNLQEEKAKITNLGKMI